MEEVVVGGEIHSVREHGEGAGYEGRVAVIFSKVDVLAAEEVAGVEVELIEE